jgi:histone deacetylase complex regulatory component SIN3
VSEAEWEEEQEALLQRLRKAEQIAAESQAEAAVYRDMLEDCYEAAKQALERKDVSPLDRNIVNRTTVFTVPDIEDVKQWGKYFLHAYMRDAGWLEDTKKALEQIKADAENLLEDNQINAELKKKIIAIAEDGLIPHI